MSYSFEDTQLIVALALRIQQMQDQAHDVMLLTLEDERATAARHANEIAKLKRKLKKARREARA